MNELIIRLFFAQHTKTGLWKAESPDIKGLLVFDRSREALVQEIPSLAKTLLEEDGKHVYDVRYVDPDECEWQLPPNSSLAKANLLPA